MYVIRLHQFGEADQLLLGDVPAPGPLPNEILVRVVASGINPIEWKIRRGGRMGQMLGRPLPVTLGWECAGIVTYVGADPHRFAVGDAVFAMLRFDRDGTHAETVAIPAEHAALKRRGLSFSQAAAVPMTAQAAWSAVEAGAISRGGRALVLGATDSVGHWLVQLLKASGVEIVATGTADRLEQVRALGADTVLDHMNDTFETAGPFDAVFDLVGGDAQERSWSVLGPGGKLV